MVKTKKSVKKKVSKKPVKSIGSSCPICKSMDNRVKKLNSCDITMIKLASMAFILFLITIWPVAMDFVHSVHWGWFLGATILLGLRPFVRAWM